MNKLIFQLGAFIGIIQPVVRLLADTVSIFAFIAIIKYTKKRS